MAFIADQYQESAFPSVEDTTVDFLEIIEITLA